MLIRFVFSFFLFFSSFLALADTINAMMSSYPASSGTLYQDPVSGNWVSDAQSLCSVAVAQKYPGHGAYTFDGSSYCVGADGYKVYLESRQGYVCPSGGTLSGSSCITPTCPSGYTLDSNGTTCTSTNPCAALAASDQPAGWYEKPIGDPNWGDFCDNGCAGSMALVVDGSPESGRYYTNGKTLTQWLKPVYSGQSCGTSSAKPSSDPADKSPPTPPKKPPCADGEGVMTDNLGNVHCVPPGTPSSAPPVVTQTKSTSVGSDGTKTEIQTTNTRDPQTGVEDKQTTTTTYPPGCSGPSCSTTKTDSTQSGPSVSPNGSVGGGGNPDPSSDFCAKNPNLQLCKGGMNEEATQKQVLDELKKITTDPTDSSFDAIKTAKQSDQSDADLKAENDKMTEAASGVVNPVSSQQSAWHEAMSDSWFSSIPASSCSPVVWQFAGKTVSFDVCKVADTTSSWLEYAMWLGISISVFVTLTGGKKGG